MAILTREDLMSQVRTRVGEDTSDEAIKFIEDVTDTIADLESKANGDGIDWKAKYEENDKTWREKYRERFFSGSAEDDDDNGHKDDDDGEPSKAPKTFEELFN